MTVSVARQNAFAPIIVEGARVSRQNAFVPIVQTGAMVSRQSLFVPIILEPVSPPGGSSRMGIGLMLGIG